ncbi:MAG: hypothetical protein QG597_1246 [Actinomycetota bacterium]|nr:hypothetical protein [Actinomycetota bacterium]
MDSIIEVPDRAVPTLTALAQMPSDVRAAVIAVFSADPPWTSLPALVQGVADVLASEHASALASALTTEVFGLASIGEVTDLNSGGVAQSVSTSAALDLNDDERASLRRGLADVLEAPTVKGLGRAAALAGEHERILLAARMFTDIRPVFTDVDAEPAGSLITHRLCLDYVRNGESEVIEITLDADGLAAVRSSIDRAQRKSASIHRWLATAASPVYQLNPTEDRED